MYLLNGSFIVNMNPIKLINSKYVSVIPYLYLFCNQYNAFDMVVIINRKNVLLADRVNKGNTTTINDFQIPLYLISSPFCILILNTHT